jgi:hypothetical protein
MDAVIKTSKSNQTVLSPIASPRHANGWTSKEFRLLA